MNNSVEREHRLAQRSSVVGAAILNSIAALVFVAEALFCLALFGRPLPGPWGNPLLEVLLALSQTASAAIIVVLGAFLRHIGANPAPFCPAQSARLLLVAALLAGRALIDIVLLGALGPTELAPVPLLALIPKVQFFLRLFALVVFLGCLATVVRYGNALKEDSDAFV